MELTKAKKYENIKYDNISQNHSDIIKVQFNTIEYLLGCLSGSRELILAQTNLEQAFMWIGKAIRSDQIWREDCVLGGTVSAKE